MEISNLVGGSKRGRRKPENSLLKSRDQLILLRGFTGVKEKGRNEENDEDAETREERLRRLKPVKSREAVMDTLTSRLK